MKGSDFEETRFFRSLGDSAARALLIGRKALVVLGLPVLTADYDFWLHIDDIEVFNRTSEPFGLYPTLSPERARKHGRYVLENDERIDVLVARSVPTVDGVIVEFAAVWQRRRTVSIGAGLTIDLPRIEDLIATKRFAPRPKDLEDIRLLEMLRQGLGDEPEQ